MKEKDTFRGPLLSKGTPTKHWMHEIQKCNQEFVSLSHQFIKPLGHACLAAGRLKRALTRGCATQMIQVSGGLLRFGGGGRGLRCCRLGWGGRRGANQR